MDLQENHVKEAPEGIPGNNEDAAVSQSILDFDTTMDRGLNSVATGIVDIRLAGVMALEHAMSHKQPTLINKWLEGIANSKALKVAGPQAWVAKYVPYKVSGTSAEYDPTSSVVFDSKLATLENCFEMGKIEKPIQDYTASELWEALGRVVKRHEGDKMRPANKDAEEALTEARTAYLLH